MEHLLRSFIIWAVTSLLIGSFAFAEGRVCKTLHDAHSAGFQYQFAEQIVSVLGWSHPMEHGTFIDYSVYNSLRKFAQSKQCAEMTETLEQFRALHSKDAPEQQRIAEALSELEKESHIDYVGVEFSASEVAEGVRSFSPFVGIEKLGMAACPSLQKEWKEANLLFWGPEFDFVTNSDGKTSLVGIDDLELRKLSSVPADDLSTLSLKGVSDPAKKALVAMVTQIQDALMPPPKIEVDQLLALESDFEIKKTLKRVVDDWTELANLGRARNGKIASNILKQPGNGVVVLGSGHLPGLLSELDQQCNRDIKN